MPGQRTGGSLARRFFFQVAGVSTAMVMLAGAVEGWFSQRETLVQIARLQTLQAQAAATEIAQYLATVQRSLAAVQALPWGSTGFGPRERREELLRLLPLNPALIDITDFDAQGRLQLVVSRTEPDRMGTALRAALPASANGGTPGTPDETSAMPKPGLGEPAFDATGVPQVPLALPRKVPDGGAATGVTVATVNLRFLADVASGLRLTEAAKGAAADGRMAASTTVGEIYVVDGRNRLIAHAQDAQVLRQRHLGQADDPIAQARTAIAAGASRLEVADAPGLDGARAITTVVPLPGTDWLVAVEQPYGVAMLPVAQTLQRTLVLLAVAALVALLASAAFARRMAAPIARLRAATAALAEGRMDERLTVRTGDEIEGLADDFNTMSAKLARSYAELEGKVVERTAELALRRDEAERANAAKTRFLASASHDLRQPMHAIGLLVGLLQQRLAQRDAADLRLLAGKTQEAVAAMQSLFGSLLDASRLDAGAVVPQPQRLSVHELFARVEATLVPLAQAKGLVLRTRLPRGAGVTASPAVFSDAALVERIVGNLVGNAIRYTACGGVLLACRRRGRDAWALQVFDTGVGIAAEDRERIFEEFVRLGAPGAVAEQGLGLGLAIVQRTARLLGTAVEVRSEPGRGSCFTLVLPALREPEPATMRAPPLAEPAADVGHDEDDLRGAFVLVVDDDARNREALAEQLHQWGCLVATAGSADAALAEARRHLRAPDVLVTDQRLGAGDDGLALIRKLRVQTALALPALLVTAEAGLPPQPERDVAVLQKPVPTARLRQALAAALKVPAN
jgi:signal transduction histidine kinase